MANEFKRSAGSEVPKSDAVAWIEKYDKEIRKDKLKDPKSIFFGRDIIERILAQTDCTGISFFFGLKHDSFASKETVHLVLVGTKEDGKLIWPETSSGKDGNGGGAVADSGLSCPPYCPR